MDIKQKDNQPETLRETVDRIRNLDIKWPDDVLAEIRKFGEGETNMDLTSARPDMMISQHGEDVYRVNDQWFPASMFADWQLAQFDQQLGNGG